MEVIIIISILLLLGIIFQVDRTVVILIALAVLCVVSLLLALFFLVACTLLVTSLRKKAECDGTDIPEGRKMKVAFYLIEGERYPCIFPSEGLSEDKFYRKGEARTVFLHKRLKRVFDRYAVMTCVLGLVFGISSSLGLCYLWLSLF